ncbi:MAG: hypothetical protein JNM25_06145 [Planctomycetes bacterium]|nr:hypothetical protein [Planctomycetota bacterium]
MLSRKLAAAAAAFALLLAAPAVAQGPQNQPELTVSPDVLTQGSVTTVAYSNPNMAGQTVVITVDNGDRRNPQTTTIEIVLNEDGRGAATWNVPYWTAAKFNAPDVEEVYCPIVR